MRVEKTKNKCDFNNNNNNNDCTGEPTSSSLSIIPVTEEEEEEEEGRDHSFYTDSGPVSHENITDYYDEPTLQDYR